MEIWKHFDGYGESRMKVLDQSTEDDLGLIDALYGRSFLKFGATHEEIKQEALRQHEIDWRSERDDLAECMVMIHTENKRIGIF